MNSILRAVLHLKSSIKERYKLRQFRKIASCGIGLRVASQSGIDCEPGSSIVVGDNCDLGCRLSAKHGASIVIGDRTTIRSGLVGAARSVAIGSDVIISNSVHIYDNNNHPTDPRARLEMTMSGSFYGEMWHWGRSSSAPVVIEDNVWIGERVTILKGVHIGRGSVVGCDSVVTKDVPAYAIACGNPARVVKVFSGYSEVLNGNDPYDDRGNNAVI